MAGTKRWEAVDLRALETQHWSGIYIFIDKGSGYICKSDHLKPFIYKDTYVLGIYTFMYIYMASSGVYTSHVYQLSERGKVLVTRLPLYVVITKLNPG